MSSSSSRPPGRYGAKPDPGTRRLALIPGVIAAVSLLIGTAALNDGPFTVVLYIVAIFAAIVGVFAFQAKQWWWLPLFAVIAVVWNPIWPLAFDGDLWQGAQYVAALVFLLAGWFIKVAIPEEQRR